MKCFQDTSHPKSDQQNIWNYMPTYFKNTFTNLPYHLDMHSSSIPCTDPQKGDILLSCGGQ